MKMSFSRINIFQNTSSNNNLETESISSSIVTCSYQEKILGNSETLYLMSCCQYFHLANKLALAAQFPWTLASKFTLDSRSEATGTQVICPRGQSGPNISLFSFLSVQFPWRHHLNLPQILGSNKNMQEVQSSETLHYSIFQYVTYHRSKSMFMIFRCPKYVQVLLNSTPGI